MSSAVDLQNVSKNFDAEILNNLSPVNTMFRKRLTQNFVPMKVKELQAEKYSRDLNEECDKFYAPVMCMYYTFVEYLDKSTKCMEDFSCFMG